MADAPGWQADVGDPAAARHVGELQRDHVLDHLVRQAADWLQMKDRWMKHRLMIDRCGHSDLAKQARVRAGRV